MICAAVETTGGTDKRLAELHYDEANWTPSHNPWLVALTVTLATFMEVLDTSIANVALPHMAGTLGASQDEATWVLTSYLVASAVILPISGWLIGAHGPQAFLHDLRGAVHGLLAAVRAGGVAAHAGLLSRVLQGVGGGGLAPSEQAILADTFPVEKRGQAFALYGMAVVVAPAIGPTLGGWITDNFNWHWIFFINLPVGLLSLFLTQSHGRRSAVPEGRKPAKQAQGRLHGPGAGRARSGLPGVRAGQGAGKGLVRRSDDHGHSHCARRLPAGLLLCWEWSHDDPIVDLKLLKNRNFGTAVFLQFVLGMVLFGSTVLIPQFLQVLLGYTAERAGMVLSPAGAGDDGDDARRRPHLGSQVRSAPDGVPSRMSITAIGVFNLTRLDLNIIFGHDHAVRCYQVMGLPFVFIPISTLNYVGVPRTKNNQISCFSNFARNLGGSVGTALLTTFLTDAADAYFCAEFACRAGKPAVFAFCGDDPKPWSAWAKTPARPRRSLWGMRGWR